MTHKEPAAEEHVAGRRLVDHAHERVQDRRTTGASAKRGDTLRQGACEEGYCVYGRDERVERDALEATYPASRS